METTQVTRDRFLKIRDVIGEVMNRGNAIDNDPSLSEAWQLANQGVGALYEGETQ